MQSIKNRKKYSIIKEDPFLWIPFLLLLFSGLIMLYSASGYLAEQRYGSQFFFVKKQFIFTLAGIIPFLFFRFLPYKYLKKTAYINILLSIFFLTAIFTTPFGHVVGGAARWLKLGGISFQPSVFSFYAIAVYLAFTISKHKENMHLFWPGVFPHIVLFFIFASFLYKQPDFGSIVIIAALIVIMLLTGGAGLKYISAIAAAGIAMGSFFVIQEPYRVGRILSFINPWKYSENLSYQTTMSLKAFIHGGFFGRGLGGGILKMKRLPEAHTDFIFSIIGEETGFIGVTLIIVLFTIIIVRGFKIAEKTKDSFGSLLAVGITSIIGIHAVINMGVALSILPPKGLTLPFISYGGSSLVMNMAAVGILMNLGASTNEK
ncbi:MAG: putative lipid II flippase FtsW [Deltaproteobacteria bacterium]|nr:MAG: putative lipid II flippase FtsW [Deltaproteobacteria bacterium]